MNRAAAFTILELMVVLFIMALMSAVVAIAVNSRMADATMKEVVAAIGGLDATMRSEAIDFDRSSTLWVDVERGEFVLRTRHTDATESREWYQLPRGFQIVQMRVSDTDAVNRREWTVACSRHGHTPTYAITIVGPEKVRTTLLIAGLSGQVQESSDERVLDNLFASLRKR